MTVEEYVVGTSKGKADKAFHSLKGEYGGVNPALVIACDTVVELNGRIFEKPKSEDDAIKMLSELSGKSHNVYSGVTLYSCLNGESDPVIHTFSEKTEVCFAELTPAIIKAYVKTGEPMDKAGGYGIQGIGGCLITGIKGDYYNVMGFPLNRFCSELNTLLKEEMLSVC